MHFFNKECQGRQLAVGGRVCGPSQSGQGFQEPILTVPQPHGPGELDLLLQFGHQRRRDGDDAIFAAFGIADANGTAFQMNVFDAEIERFANAQAAAIEKPGDEIGRISPVVGNRRQ